MQRSKALSIEALIIKMQKTLTYKYLHSQQQKYQFL